MLSDFDSHFSTLYLQTSTLRRPSCLSSPPWNPTITFRCVKARVYQISSTCFEFVLNRVISAIEKTTHLQYNFSFIIHDWNIFGLCNDYCKVRLNQKPISRVCYRSSFLSMHRIIRHLHASRPASC